MKVLLPLFLTVLLDLVRKTMFQYAIKCDKCSLLFYFSFPDSPLFSSYDYLLWFIEWFLIKTNSSQTQALCDGVLITQEGKIVSPLI